MALCLEGLCRTVRPPGHMHIDAAEAQQQLKSPIKCLHFSVKKDEDPHLDATCFLVHRGDPALQLTIIAYPGDNLPRFFPQWDHLNHCGRFMCPHPLYPRVHMQHIFSLILTHIVA